MAELKTAFVYLHAQAGPDYFADVPFAWTAGELRRLGLGADVFHVHFERGDLALQERLCGELVARLAEGGYRLAVLEHCWLPELITAIQAAGLLVCMTEPEAVLEGARPDFVLRHFTNHRQPLIDLVEALRDSGELAAIPNLSWHGGAALRSNPEQAHPDVPDARRPFCPVVDRVTIGTPMDDRGHDHPIRKTLDTNKGCPFSLDVRKNPAFSGFSLESPGVTLAGCSFCPMGGDYRTLPTADAVQTHLDQLAWYQQHLPRLDEVVLRDQHAIRYVPELLQGAIERGLRPFGLLVPGRGDAILRYGEQMARASELAAGTGFWWTIYLVGFESFSQPQLDLYNKGVTVAQYAEALVQLRALHAEFPGSFRLYAGGASSFILFSPWTTLDDLRANVDFCKRHSVWRLARGLAATRMRLYPNLPLFHKAKAEGLLEGSAPEDRGAAWTGYAAEAGWRYQHPEVALVEALTRRLQRWCKVDEQVGLLDACERHVRRVRERGGDVAAIDVDAIEAAWRRLRRLWNRASEIHELSAAQRRAGAAKVQAQRARTVLMGKACNNHCRTCVADHAQHEVKDDRLLGSVEEAAATGRVTLTGREVLMVPRVLKLAKKAAGKDVRVEIVTNGRALASQGAAGKLARAGVTDVLIKRHRLADEHEDAFCDAEGAGAQMWQGVAQLVQEAPGLRWRLLLVAAQDGLGELAAIADKARALGAAGVQLKVMAGEVDLAQIRRLEAEIAAFLRQDNVTVEGF